MYTHYNHFFYTYLQVSLYAVNRFKMINFLIEDTKTIKHYFIDHASIGHHKERSSVRLYTMDEIYHLIEHVVEKMYVLIYIAIF